MLGVGAKFPEFSLTATVSTDYDPATAFKRITSEDYAGKWKLFFFWPKDFTFVCPTEIAAFGELNAEFQARNCQVLGGSTDGEFVHRAWRESHPHLHDLPFPMLADVKHELCEALGILDPVEGVALRATYLVNPEGVIKFVSVYDLAVGRNPEEVLRTLDALQSGGLCGCGWSKGQKNLTVAPA